MTKKSLDTLQNVVLVVSGKQRLDYIRVSRQKIVKQ